MTATPIMHNLRSTHTKANRDLMRTHKIINLDPAAHTRPR